MRKISILLFASVLLFCSCGKKVLFEESRTFANHTWYRFEPEKFMVNATSVDDCYDIYITAQVDTGQFHAAELPLSVNLYSPNGDRRMFPTTLVLRDAHGGWQGEIKGGVLTVTKNVRPYFFFNSKGEYRVELAQTTHYYEVHGVQTIELKLVKAELEYPE